MDNLTERAGYGMWAMLLVVLALSLTIGIVPTQAQQGTPIEIREQVQLITGRAGAQGLGIYMVPALKEGETLYVYVEGTSGNLDPIAALTDMPIEPTTLGDAFFGQVDLVIAEGRDPLEALPEIYDGLFVAWDDDSGKDTMLPLSSPFRPMETTICW